jgi:membrane protease YdiL (CAAX protease family)
MDFSLLILVAIVVGYVGAIIYFANQDDIARTAAKSVANSKPAFGADELAARQRSTILRWMLYGVIAANIVFSLLILQLSLLGNLSENSAEFQQLDMELPEVDQAAAVASLVLAVVVGVAALRVITSDTTRQWIDRRIGSRGLYNPDSSVHTVAIILSLLLVSLSYSQFVISGGLSGLAESVELSGVSLGAELFTAALMLAAAFLGIGLAIRRTLGQSLVRLGLRLPTTQDVIWGVGAGIVLYIALIIMGVIWSATSSPEQIAEQSAAAEQIARSFNTLPLAFALSLAAALSEEILFRGALQPIFGLIPTSLFFALIHVQYTLTPATLIIFVVGLGLGWVRQRQSTSAAIIAHFVYNFVQLALAILAGGLLGSSS